jgi:hypothetical protein
MSGIEEQLRIELRREAERYQPGPDAWARLQQRNRRRSRTVRWLPATAVAAAVLAAVTGTVLALRPGHSSTPTASGPVPAACLSVPRSATALSKPGFNTAPMSGYLVDTATGEVFCVNVNKQFWGTRVGAGALQAAGMTRMTFSIDNLGGPATVVVGLIGTAGDTVQLTDGDTHQPLLGPVDYANLGGRRIFLYVAPESRRHVEVRVIGAGGSVVDTRTVAPQAAVTR